WPATPRAAVSGHSLQSIASVTNEKLIRTEASRTKARFQKCATDKANLELVRSLILPLPSAFADRRPKTAAATGHPWRRRRPKSRTRAPARSRSGWRRQNWLFQALPAAWRGDSGLGRKRSPGIGIARPR